MTPEERQQIRARARARADRMGHRRADTDPEPAAAVVQLPTHNPRALRMLLDRGHLTPEQADRARHLFAAVAQYVREEDS